MDQGIEMVAVRHRATLSYEYVTPSIIQTSTHNLEE